MSTSCFSRRSSGVTPMMQRTRRSRMMILSMLLVLLEVAPTIDEDDLTGHELALRQEDDGARDLLGHAVPFERNGAGALLNVLERLARRRQNQPRSDGVDRDLRRIVERHHLG